MLPPNQGLHGKIQEFREKSRNSGKNPGIQGKIQEFREKSRNFLLSQGKSGEKEMFEKVVTFYLAYYCFRVTTFPYSITRDNCSG